MFVKGLLIALFAFCGVSSFDQSPSESCDSLPTPISLYIENCEHFPCPIYSEYYVNAQWDFLATNPISKLIPTAEYSLFGRVYFPYDLKIKNGCNNLVGEAQCPLKPNDVGTFRLSFPVPRIPVSGISVWIKFSLKDEYKHVHSCFKVKFVVKKGH